MYDEILLVLISLKQKSSTIFGNFELWKYQKSYPEVLMR